MKISLIVTCELESTMPVFHTDDRERILIPRMLTPSNSFTGCKAKDKEIAQLTADKTDAEANLQTAKDALATAEQTIADKQAQIAALTNEAGEELNSGESPENNGEGVKTPQLRSFDGSKYKTNVERKAAFKRFLQGEE